MEIAIERMKNRLLNASWQHGVRVCRNEADPLPARGLKTIKVALRCIRKGKFNLAGKVMQSNEAAAQIWREALA